MEPTLIPGMTAAAYLESLIVGAAMSTLPIQKSEMDMLKLMIEHEVKYRQQQEQD